MFKITPLLYEHAPEKVKAVYDDILQILNIDTVPVFFQIIGNFEDYLSYIWRQIKPNLTDSSFKLIAKEIEAISTSSMTRIYKADPAVISYLQKHIVNKEDIYDLKKNLQSVTHINAQLALIFVVLREAVKGWAVGAKKIEGNQKEFESVQSYVQEDLKEELCMQSTEANLGEPSKDLARAQNGIQKSFYAHFLALLLTEIEELMKDETYLYERVNLEKHILNTIPRITHVIDSSYSKISHIASKYEHFDELIHLLYDHFPTLIVYELNTSLLGIRILSLLEYAMTSEGNKDITTY